MRLFFAVIPFATAILLSVLFWSKLWTGGGFIGGDLYTYFLPQKVWYAERLQAGEFPLWNSLAGHGYPLVGESQTGAFYPSNVVLYRFFDANLAYNISHLAHYIATFVVAYWLARRLRLSMLSSLLAAMIYTYGWFPPRASLEWAIVGGLYFVWGLWNAESFLQEGRWRYLLLLSAGLGLHLLAGHFNLAWVTLLTLAVYVPARLWFSTELLAESVLARKPRVLAWFAGSVCWGFLLAAVQLWPTWELKQVSQRLTPDMGFGHIPPLYLSQMFLPWMWYAPDVDTDRAIQALRAFSIDSATNKTEAHLYVGLIPWLLLLAAAVMRRFRESSTRRIWMLWALLSVFMILLATGVFLPLIRYLPGFNFFSGLGRYGLAASLGLALMSAAAMDFVVSAFLSRAMTIASAAQGKPTPSPLGLSQWILGIFTMPNVDQERSAVVQRPVPTEASSVGFVPFSAGLGLFIALIFGVAVFDLWIVSQWVTNAFPLEDPPIAHRSQSEIRRVLAAVPQPVRLFAPGPNLPTLTGFSATPQYLGLAPREYFDPKLIMPTESADPQSIADQVAWLRKAGVTHLLRFEPLNSARWPVQLVWRGYDPLIHPAWGRSPNEPLLLYQLRDAPGRVRFANPSTGCTVRVTDYRANQVTLQANSTNGGEVILTDLFYPGWEVSIDGQPAEAHRAEGMYRGVDVPTGEHTIAWKFQPSSVLRGLLVSIMAAFVWFSALVYTGLKDGWLKSIE
ncbi:MAG: YfhO family protein [Planctomycetia bacterium]|nr:YfhO family protein [Planctomycetia bacterium]